MIFASTYTGIGIMAIIIVAVIIEMMERTPIVIPIIIKLDRNLFATRKFDAIALNSPKDMAQNRRDRAIMP
jgi:hypothetical protein